MIKKFLNKKLFFNLTVLFYLILGIYSLVSRGTVFDLQSFNDYRKEQGVGYKISLKNPITLQDGSYSFFVDENSNLLDRKELVVPESEKEKINQIVNEGVDVSFERRGLADMVHRPKSALFGVASVLMFLTLISLFFERITSPNEEKKEGPNSLDLVFKRFFVFKIHFSFFIASLILAMIISVSISSREYSIKNLSLFLNNKKPSSFSLVNKEIDKQLNIVRYSILELKEGSSNSYKKPLFIRNKLVLPGDIKDQSSLIKKTGLTVSRTTGVLLDIYCRPDQYSIYLCLFFFCLTAGSLVYREIQKDKEKYGSNTGVEYKKEKESSKAIPLSFKDIAGIDEVKEQIEEIVALFKDSSKIREMGGRVPKGVILNGPPGTGKTLLAKVTASECGANFIHSSGSEFVEMYVGVGAKRVRELFAKARSLSPCIIFIDEIDAVAGKRGIDQNSEREQTLNELLVQMDGFGATDNIIVMAATNQLEKLDPAILRPGRFDRQVSVFLPDAKGREEILNVYLKKCKNKSVNPKKVAKSIAGFSGADISNLVNEAILHAAKSGKEYITNKELLWAKDKILMGSERKIKIDSEEMKKTAFHEIGHAFLAKKLKLGKVSSVSIVPRGKALGVTQLESEDMYSLKKDKAIDQIAMLLAGRACENIFFSELSTGASNDLQRAYSLAKSMVSIWGMGSLGPISVDETAYRTLSEGMKLKIDEGAIEIVKNAENKAESIIRENLNLIEKMSFALLEKEVLSEKDLDKLMNN